MLSICLDQSKILSFGKELNDIWLKHGRKDNGKEKIYQGRLYVAYFTWFN